MRLNPSRPQLTSSTGRIGHLEPVLHPQQTKSGMRANLPLRGRGRAGGTLLLISLYAAAEKKPSKVESCRDGQFPTQPVGSG